jgi:hypothetical protein
MFTRLCLGCVLGLTLIAFSPAGANAEGLFNRDGGLFGGDKARGPENDGDKARGPENEGRHGDKARGPENEGRHFAFFDQEDRRNHHKKHIPHCGRDLDECHISKPRH